MKKTLPLLTAFFMSILTGYSQQKTGMFDGNEDVGNPAKKGSATYNTESQEYMMSCGGKNISVTFNWNFRSSVDFYR